MKTGAVLINTVKWNLVDLASFFSALTDNHLKAGTFDGLGKGEYWEKLTSLSADKFVWFPQTGFKTSDANYRASMIDAKAVVDILNCSFNSNINNPDFREKRKSSP